MERQKSYKGQYLSDLGWKKLVQLAETIFGDLKGSSSRVTKEAGSWSYENIEDFLTDFNPMDSNLYLDFQEHQRVRLMHYEKFGWEVRSKDKLKIARFETEADSIVATEIIPHPEAIEPQLKKPTLFIGHGRHGDWRDLKDHLHEKHGIPIEAYEVGSRAGHTIRDVLEDMLDGSELAVLVHTPEDELADGTFNTRPNVIHETGLFQGRLGFSRAIILLKDGANEFTNVSGVQQIRYRNIVETYGDILAWIQRETGS